MKRISLALIGFILFSFVETSNAQEKDSLEQTSSKVEKRSVKKEKAGKPALPPNFSFTELNNGLDVLVIRDSMVPLATVELAFKTGAITEPSDWDGITNFYEELFFSANRDYPSQNAINERAAQLGMQYDAKTGYERSGYFLTLHRSNLAYGLDFMNAAARYPKLLFGDIEKARSQVLSNYGQLQNDPAFHFGRDLKKSMWQKHFSRKNIIGKDSVLEDLKAKDLKSLRKHYYYPNNALLIIAGDVNSQNAQQLTRRIFGTWESSGFDIFEKHAIPEFASFDRTISFLTEAKTVQSPSLVYGYHGPDTRKDISATYAAKVFSNILKQSDSKFQKALVDSGLAMKAGLKYKTLHHVGPIKIHIQPKTHKVRKAAKVLDQHIKMWDTSTYFTDAQLKTAKQMIRNQFTYQKQKTSDHVHKVSSWWASADLEYYNNYIDSIMAVSRQDIQEFVREYIQGEHHVIGAMVSPEMKKKAKVEEVARNTKPIEKYATLYELNSSKITDSADIAAVRDVEYIMRINPNAHLTIHGYTDYTGPSWYNEALSKDRAQAAKDLILKWGRVSGDRIDVIGHGEKPKATSEEKRQAHRSARFEITFPQDGDSKNSEK